MEHKQTKIMIPTPKPLQSTLVGKIARTIFSYLPYTGLVQKPTFRPHGISAIVRVRNVVDWVESSILSIKDFADEIVVVDNGSSDGTKEILEKLSEIGSLNLRIYNYPNLNLCDLSNIALSLTMYRWIIRWDADFIAYTEGEFDIRNLRKIILSLDPRRYYVISLYNIELAGDLEHQIRGRETHCENYLHTYSSDVKFVLKKRSKSGLRLESVYIPRYFKFLLIKGFYFFHVKVRPKKEIFAQQLWYNWMNEHNFGTFPTLEKYVDYRLEKDWKNDWESAENFYLQKLLPELQPYDKDKFGNYPSLLEKLRLNSRYKIIYENGKIVKRIE